MISSLCTSLSVFESDCTEVPSPLHRKSGFSYRDDGASARIVYRNGAPVDAVELEELCLKVGCHSRNNSGSSIQTCFLGTEGGRAGFRWKPAAEAVQGRGIFLSGLSKRGSRNSSSAQKDCRTHLAPNPFQSPTRAVCASFVSPDKPRAALVGPLRGCHPLSRLARPPDIMHACRWGGRSARCTKWRPRCGVHSSSPPSRARLGTQRATWCNRA